ncbi:MAG: NAD(P)-binding domain-containing protein [Phycisphaerales bacterium]
MSEIESYEVALVGAGPIGVEMAVALKREGVRYIHYDADQVGAAITRFPPQTPFFSSPERIQIAGVPLQTDDQTKATREEYLTYLRCVVIQFDLDINTYERVISVNAVGDEAEPRFRIESRDMNGATRIVEAGRVILSVGNMQVPRALGILGEDLPHVSHYFGEAHTYFRRRLLIVGGKNSAVEAALRCYRAGVDVTLSYRRDEIPDKVKYWLRPEILSLFKSGDIGWRPRTAPVRIEPGRVALAPTDDDGAPLADADPTWIDADFVLALTGYTQNTDLFERVGVELVGEQRRPAHDRRTMETNIPGIHVIGTGSAGSERSVRVFIETSHVHVERVMAVIRGEPPTLDQPEPTFALPES